ncbi:unnamed protein product [Acanthoscelides obtectus]|uniref:Uncharacterized protein n=1 Tax=Acanthoscelides obtectus TaxID=200917 RepID=A0A9P0P201_ACAOB|nr:unnamed protein product [Acanthoscelides obtectus]CAK1648665.1 hypothetical protein AOBTE_LOCUS15812 [Acanthoscelides obtectus]
MKNFLVKMTLMVITLRRICWTSKLLMTKTIQSPMMVSILKMTCP